MSPTSKKKGLAKHQLKKFAKLFPEKVETVKGEFGIGGQTRSVKFKKYAITGKTLGEGVVIKEYLPKKMDFETFFKALNSTYQLTKEVHSAGLPVAKPISLKIEKRTDEEGRPIKVVVLKEELIEGKTRGQLFNEYLDKKRKGELTEKAEEEDKKLWDAYGVAVKKIHKYINERQETKAGIIEPVYGNLQLDTHIENAIWNGEEFIFMDIGHGRVKKKEK
ncbi:MAG: hypothetical protein KAW41_05330 [Candidatus Diapherotrites archaeon]|nr:hypothetical protein [Candidatus Diapherotrites archaeon]